MSRRPPKDVAARRLTIVGLITGEGLSFSDILAGLKPRPSTRTLREDIAWLSVNFPQRLRKRRTGGGFSPNLAYRWTGPAPLLLSQPLHWLTEEELIALITARGLLRQPDPTRPATTGPDPEKDPLAEAVDGLLSRAGVKEAADAIARDAIVVSRFGALGSDPDCLATVLAATVLSDGIHFEYDNLAGQRHSVHASPLRMLLIKAEWYLLAWSGSLKAYRVARMSGAMRGKQPAGRPIFIPSNEINEKFRDAFYATGSERPEDRKRVILAVNPEGWRQIAGRRWGDRQKIEEQPMDLPDGWRRIHFTTTGLAECRHWVLSHGANIRAEAPTELVEWLHGQAEAVMNYCNERK